MYLCTKESIMHHPEIAIVDPNTLTCLGCNLQIFLCLFLEKLNMPQNTPVTKAS